MLLPRSLQISCDYDARGRYLYRSFDDRWGLIHVVRFYLRVRSCDVACAAKKERKKKKSLVEAVVPDVASANSQAKSHHVNRALATALELCLAAVVRRGKWRPGMQSRFVEWQFEATEPRYRARQWPIVARLRSPSRRRLVVFSRGPGVRRPL